MTPLPPDLQRAKEFHGHLGPYLVLGLRIGQALVRTLSPRPYFGLEVRVTGPPSPPPRCVLDGLQLSAGCTFGKGNLTHEPGEKMVVTGTNTDTGQRVTVETHQALLAEAGRTMREQGDEAGAAVVWEAAEAELFTVVDCAPQPDTSPAGA